MTDILKFQQLLNNVNCEFTVRYCMDEYGWGGYPYNFNKVGNYIAMEIKDATDINIIFNNDGSFKRFTHHG